MREVLKVTANGLCGTIYDKKGNVRQNWNVLENSLIKQEQIIEGSAETV